MENFGNTLKEVAINEIKEVAAKTGEAFKEIKPAIEKTLDEIADSWDNLFDELSKDTSEFYTSYKERLDQTPKEGERGEWIGERGEGKFIPDLDLSRNEELAEKMKECNIDGIEYKNCEPDFSECAEATVKIDNMTENRYDYRDENGDMQDGNFTQADKKLAEQFNTENRDGKDNWTEKDVEKYRKENKLTWHERCDTEAMDLVPTEIHSFFDHSGGVAECKARDSVGGEFDE
ncbi:MAG: HNH endonuclease [Lachnospiraceae bacterium]|nr:HNH endonuclease [Lachnospiraceae bacterium]